MTRLAVLLAVPWLAWTAFAQVDLDLVMDRLMFLPSEDIEVGVRISNFTGDPLKLGEEPQWLQFTVEELHGRVSAKLQEPPESGEFTLEQATRGKLRYNLTPLFAVDTPGVYRVSATMRLPTGEDISSRAETFEIVSGVKLSEPREVGYRLPDGTIERRKFVLQRASFLRRIQLYARLTDASESHTYKVIRLGNTVSFDRPEWVVDRETQFHVLHRADSNNYLYHIIAPDGSLTLRQLMVSSGDGQPEIRVNEEGEVRVFGAARRLSPGDLPKPVASVSSTNSPAVLERPTTTTNEVQAPKQP